MGFLTMEAPEEGDPVLEWGRFFWVLRSAGPFDSFMNVHPPPESGRGDTETAIEGRRDWELMGRAASLRLDGAFGKPDLKLRNRNRS